jgi:hypothetical protein
MEKEPKIQSLDEIKRFKELFGFINSNKLSEEYRNAYEESAEIAKFFIANKNRSSWDEASFRQGIEEKYPKVSESFCDALVRCIENYNSPTNIPSEPL